MSYSKQDKPIIPEDKISFSTSENLSQGPTLTSYAQEEGGTPLYTDAMYNFVPGTCFEIGFSLALLDNPGEGGKTIDRFAAQLSAILDKVYHTEFGNQLFRLSDTSPEMTLKEYFNNKIFKELSPSSDQIGRCQDEPLLQVGLMVREKNGCNSN